MYKGLKLSDLFLLNSTLISIQKLNQISQTKNFGIIYNNRKIQQSFQNIRLTLDSNLYLCQMLDLLNTFLLYF